MISDFGPNNKLLHVLDIYDDIRCLRSIQPYLDYIVEHFGDLIEKGIAMLENVAPQLKQALGKSPTGSDFRIF